jgi:hypothetical protein
VDGKGFEFLKDPAPLPKRCAFCRQEVGTDDPTRCARCAALYHSDCWAANSQRCAVYGCEPAEKPVEAVPVRVAVRPTYRLPAESNSGWSRGGWIFLVVLIPNIIRLVASTHSRSTSPIESPPVRIESGPRRSLFFERGCFNYDLQEWKESISNFQMAAAGDPSLRDEAQIRIFFAASRLGESEKALGAFRGYLQTRLNPDSRTWEAQSLRFVAGMIPESEYLDVAAAEPERVSQALFYAATLRLIAGDTPAARAFFARCVATGTGRSREVQTAKWEIDALDRKR